MMNSFAVCFAIWIVSIDPSLSPRMETGPSAPRTDSVAPKLDSGATLLSNSVNLRDFYNGEPTFDAAFERAISAAAKRKSAVIPNKVSTVAASVIVPPGSFLVRKSIVVREGVRLVGVSKGASVIVYEGAGGSALVLGAPPLSPTGGALAQTEFSNVSLENLTVLGRNREGTVGVRFDGCIRGSYIQDCQISNFGVNVQGGGSYGFNITNNYIHDAVVNNIRWSSPTASSIRGNRIDDAGKQGILIDDRLGSEIIGLTISENTIQSSHRSGLMVEDAVQASVENNFFESNCLDEQHCAHLLFVPSSSTNPKKSMSINILGNFFTPGERSKHFPNKANNRPIEVRNAQNLNLIGVVARGFSSVQSDPNSGIGVKLGLPESKDVKVDYVFSRGCVFNGMSSPFFSGNPATILDVK